MLPLAVLVYFAFHSYLLQLYQYHRLSTHMTLIIFLQLYLFFRKQPKTYEPLYEIAQKRQRQSNKPSQPLNQCPICKNVKPSRYYHCRRCNICVYRMDHHCQWLNNCIGHSNTKPYFHFLIHLFIHSLILLLRVFVWDFEAITANHERKIYLLFLILPVVFILYETQRLLQDFYSMVKINQTLIESYKKVKGKNQSIIRNLQQFFSTHNTIIWLVPFYLPFSDTSKTSNLYEETEKMEEEEKETQDLTYADEYLYGTDEDHQHDCHHQHKEN